MGSSDGARLHTRRLFSPSATSEPGWVVSQTETTWILIRVAPVTSSGGGKTWKAVCSIYRGSCGSLGTCRVPLRLHLCGFGDPARPSVDCTACVSAAGRREAGHIRYIVIGSFWISSVQCEKESMFWNMCLGRYVGTTFVGGTGFQTSRRRMSHLHSVAR